MERERERLLLVSQGLPLMIIRRMANREGGRVRINVRTRHTSLSPSVARPSKPILIGPRPHTCILDFRRIAFSGGRAPVGRLHHLSGPAIEQTDRSLRSSQVGIFMNVDRYDHSRAHDCSNDARRARAQQQT